MASQITQAIEYIADFIAKKVLTKLVALDERVSNIETASGGGAYPPVEIDGELKANYLDSNNTVTGTNQLTIYPQGAYITAINKARQATLIVDVMVDGNTNTRYSGSNRAGIQAEVMYTDSTREWLQVFTAEEVFRSTLSQTLNVPDGKTVAGIVRVILVGNLPNAKAVRVGNPRLIVGDYK